MAIKAVIFDIGGVLLLNTTHEKAQEWEGRAGLQKGEVFKFINRSGLSDAATRGKMPTETVWRKVSEHFKIEPEQIQEFQDEFLVGEHVNTELADFLQSLRPQYKTATLSNAWPGTREALNQRYGLDKLVDTQIFSAEEGMLKPETRFYQLALIRLHVQNYEALFVDDRADNVDGASVLGIHSVLYRDNEQTIMEVKRLLEKNAK